MLKEKLVLDHKLALTWMIIIWDRDKIKRVFFVPIMLFFVLIMLFFPIMLFWPKCFHFQKRIVSGSITSARLVTGVLISSSSITKWDGLQVAIIHISFVKARLFSLMNKANFLLQNSLAFLSHVYKLNVFTIFADRKYDRHIGNSMWNIQNSVRGNVPNCLLSASNSRIFSAFQFQNTVLGIGEE